MSVICTWSIWRQTNECVFEKWNREKWVAANSAAQKQALSHAGNCMLALWDVGNLIQSCVPLDHYIKVLPSWHSCFGFALHWIAVLWLHIYCPPLSQCFSNAHACKCALTVVVPLYAWPQSDLSKGKQHCALTIIGFLCEILLPDLAYCCGLWPGIAIFSKLVMLWLAARKETLQQKR